MYTLFSGLASAIMIHFFTYGFSVAILRPCSLQKGVASFDHVVITKQQSPVV